MLIYQRVTVSKKNRQNTWAILVLGSLAWWNICDAFFYGAPSKEAAWFWHQLGAVGWCGFIAISAYYFLVMTALEQKINTSLKILFWSVPVALTLRFMLLRPTALAEDLVLSSSNLGWTFVQHYQSIWPFVFMAYLFVYLGGALLYLYIWQKQDKSPYMQRLYKDLVRLDCIVVTIGFVFIFVLPYFTPLLPPMGCIATLIFGVWYWGWLRNYDFLYVDLALPPACLLESCIDGMLVTDEDYRILYANEQSKVMLGQAVDASYTDYLLEESRGLLLAFAASAQEKISPLPLELKNGKRVICSINRIQAKKRRVAVLLLCMHDVSQLKETQERLAYLVHYDELTGLLNRRGLGEVMEEWAKDFACGKQDFSLLFLDLTDFKRINDTFGHHAGDAALVATAQALRSVAGEGDVLSRFAGDEFVVLHKDGEEDQLSECFRSAVRAIDSSSFAPGFQMNIDIGRSRYSEVGNLNALFQIADMRMYAQKRHAPVPGESLFGSP